MRATTQEKKSTNKVSKTSTARMKATKSKVTVDKMTDKATDKKKAKKTPEGATKYKGLKIGEKLPALALASTNHESMRLGDLKGKKVVLYFYPKDNTPGCTLEGQDFKKLHGQFKKLNTEILGVSRDSVKSHQGFSQKCGFPFELLSDPDDKLAKIFDVIQMKSLYGRKFEGIERSTFVLDEKGILKGEWRKVKVAGHADEVLAFIKNM